MVAAVVGIVTSLTVVGVAVAAPDPYRPQQWNLERIGASSAGASGQGQDQVVAVLDSGVDLGHPDLVDRFVRRDDGTVLGRDVVDDDDVPQDVLGHGTMVAGVAAATADNDIGVAGVAPLAGLLPVRVLDEEGRGTSADVDEGIRWAVDNGATVVNLSLESATATDGDSLRGGVTVAAPVDAVQYAWDHGVIVVAAAGNSGSGFTDYPRASPVVLVGATDREDRRTDFSDSGRDDLLMAPGVDIVSTWCRAPGDDHCVQGTHTYGIADGTSFAAPHVAAALAVLRGAGHDHEAAVERLRDTARDLGQEGRDDETGYGLIDLVAAVADAPTPSEPGPGTRTSTPGTATPTVATTTATTTPGPSAPDAPSTAPPDATSESPGTSPHQPDPAVSPAPEVTVPDVDASPIAAPDDDVERRGLWTVAAILLLLGTVLAVGGTWARRP